MVKLISNHEGSIILVQDIRQRFGGWKETFEVHATGEIATLFPRRSFGAKKEFSVRELESGSRWQIFSIVVASASKKELIFCNVHYIKSGRVDDLFLQSFRRNEDYLKRAEFVCIVGNFNLSICQNYSGMTGCKFLNPENLGGVKLFTLWRTSSPNQAVPEFTHSRYQEHSSITSCAMTD